MNNWSDIFAPLIGRILMGGYFLWHGIEGVLNFPATVATFGQAGIGLPFEVAVIAIAVEVLGGLALIVGFGTQFAAIGLTLFLMISVFIYTGVPGFGDHILEDVAIIGGLFYISAYGSGAWSPLWHYRSYK